MSVVSVLIPFRFNGDGPREAALNFVRDWYRERHTDYEICLGTIDDRLAWSKGMAVDRAATRARGGVLVVADADVLVSVDALTTCVLAVLEGAAEWAIPHSMVYRLNLRGTAAVYGDTLPGEPRPIPRQFLERREHPAPVGGGIVVCTRQAFDSVEGIDPRFTDWGGEDISFGRALDTLCGSPYRHHATMWHFWHERMTRRPGNRAFPANERLANAYLAANGDVAAMRALIGTRHDPAIGEAVPLPGGAGGR